MIRLSTWFSALRITVDQYLTSQCVLALALLLCSRATAQSPGPADGIAQFSTHEWGIDLSSSTVHLSFPLRSKSGKIPYSSTIEETNYYALGSDNSGNTIWLLWPDDTTGPSFSDSVRQVSFSGTVTGADCPGLPLYNYVTYVVQSISDASGASHQLQHQLAWIRNNHAGCPAQQAPVSVGVTDNSGYILYADTTGNPVAYDKAGYKFILSVPAVGGWIGTHAFNSLSGTVVDPDGASISGGSSAGGLLGGAIQDTLNTTVLSLTGGGGRGSGLVPTNAAYTDASGNPQQYSMTYTSLPIQTNFGCSMSNGVLIPEHHSTSNVLTSIQTPTGGHYTISYEPTPGYSGYYTGRVAQITFPSGGSISYAYSDDSGHNGMDCSFLSHGVINTLPRVPKITVTVNDNNGNSSVYTYVHSAYYTTPATVTKTDPAGNQTVYTFDGIGEFQAEVQYYQGSASGTPLKTVVTCYNGNTTNCASSASLPITQTDVYTSLGTSASNHVKTTYDSTENVTSVVAYDFGATFPTSQTYIFYGQSWNGTSCTAYPTGTYIADTPCYSHTENSAGADIAKTQITYSNTGHPTSGSEWKSGSLWLTGTATFNANGTVATSTDVNGALSTYAYNGTGGCNSMLPTSVTVTGTGLPSGGLTSSTQWDCNGGVATKSLDANLQPTTTDYTLV